jgi:hypothetical protein
MIIQRLLISLLILLVQIRPGFSQDTISKKTSGFAQVGFSASGGNLILYTTSFRGEIKQESPIIEWSTNASFLYGINLTGGEKKTQNRESYLSAAFYRRWGNWKIVLFSENENSFLRKTIYRGNIGFGGAYKILSKSGFEIDISQAVMPEFYFSDNRVNDRITFRSSTRLNFTWSKGPFKLSSATLIQPAIYTSPEVSSKNNFNLRSNTLLEVKTYKGISLGISNETIVQTYSSYLYPNLKPYDYRFEFIVKYSR